MPIADKSLLARELPLKVFTCDRWAAHALRDIPALLSDHAHLERKAAANALSLMHRWPEQCADPNLNIEWVGFLAEVARDEVAHLELVASILNQRGAIFGKYHDNAYAQGLREYERRGEDAKDLVDRLIVSALIEARSCERFHLLSIASADQELAKLYRGLWSSEHGHYKMFLELAMRVMDRTLVEARWKEYLDIEAAVIQAQSPGSRVHSWISPEGY